MPCQTVGKIRPPGPVAQGAPSLGCVPRGRLLRPVRSGWAAWHRPPVPTGSFLSAGGSVATAAVVCCLCFFGHALLLLFLRSVGPVLLCRCHLLLRRRRFDLRVLSVGVTVGGLCSSQRFRGATRIKEIRPLKPLKVVILVLFS